MSAALERVVDRFREACASDERVLAAFLGGSLAAGRADAHSDLDLYVIAREDACAALVDGRAVFVVRLGEPAFVDVTRDFEGLGFDMLHFVLANGVHGEIAIAHPRSVRRTHGGPHRVLVDKTGVLAGVEFPLAARSSEQARAAGERALSWFWLHAIALAKNLARERMWIAHHQLERMRACLVELLRVAEPTFAEGRDHERALVESVVGLQTHAIAGASRRLVETYHAVAPRAAARLGVPEQHALARVAEAKLAG